MCFCNNATTNENRPLSRIKDTRISPSWQHFYMVVVLDSARRTGRCFTRLLTLPYFARKFVGRASTSSASISSSRTSQWYGHESFRLCLSIVYFCLLFGNTVSSILVLSISCFASLRLSLINHKLELSTRTPSHIIVPSISADNLSLTSQQAREGRLHLCI
jgi:hypothetical protein